MKKYIYINGEDCYDMKKVKRDPYLIFSYSDTKFNDTAIEVDVTEEQLKIINEYRYISNKLVYDESISITIHQEKLRSKRNFLLEGFDKYNMSVTRGIIQETNLQKNEILEWYFKILDLDEVAIDNPPDRIKYYL